MMQKTIKLKSILIVLILWYIFMYSVTDTNTVYASKSNKYLVLVQQENGSWKKYKNMIEESDNGTLMIKAKPISKALGFTYIKNTNGTFVIKRNSNRFNTYKKNSKEFTYGSSYTNAVKLASHISYTSSISKYYLCQLNTLSTLINFKYFDNIEGKVYKGYKGIICYSKYKQIPSEVPKSTTDSVKEPKTKPQPEPTKITIEGVEFPVRKKFLSLDDALSDWGGTVLQWYELEEAVDSKIIETTDLYVGNDTISFTHIGAGSDGIYLSKSKSEYKISINVKLNNSVIANQNAAIVKAMITTISSKPMAVYTAIYESFTTSNTYGINEDTYVTIGDCSIKVTVKDGTVVYYIKKAE